MSRNALNTDTSSMDPMMRPLAWSQRTIVISTTSPTGRASSRVLPWGKRQRVLGMKTRCPAVRTSRPPSECPCTTARKISLSVWQASRICSERWRMRLRSWLSADAMKARLGSKSSWTPTMENSRTIPTARCSVGGKLQEAWVRRFGGSRRAESERYGRAN